MTNHEIEIRAKQAYIEYRTRSLNPNCGCFPTWEELPEAARQIWIGAVRREND